MTCRTQCRLAPLPCCSSQIQSVAMALAVNDVHLAVVIYVVADDRKPCITQVPVGMPFPSDRGWHRYFQTSRME